MIKVTDSTAVLAAFLSSDRLVLPDILPVKSRVHDIELLTQAILDYQPYVHRKLRTDDVQAMISLYQLSNGNTTLRPLLSSLANEYLDWQGNCFVVKPQRLSDWLALLSLLDGSWVIAQAYADLHVNFEFSVSELAHCIESFQCPFALPRRMSKSFADNHVHLGGHGYLGPSLLSFCLYGAEIKNKFHWPVRPEYTVYESGYLNKQDIATQCCLIGDALAHGVFTNDKTIQYRDNTTSGDKFEHKTLDAIKCYEAETAPQQFIAKATCESQPSAKRWLLYLTGLLVESRIESGSLLLLARLTNILRNYMLVSGVGLSQFVEVSRFGARHQRGESHTLGAGVVNESLEADLDKGVMREFRTTPNTLLKGKNQKIKPDAFFASLKQLYLNSFAENTHFVLHFTRSGSREDKLQEARRHALRQQTELLQDFTHSVTFSEQECETISGLAKFAYLDLRKAIRGYDVAGNENELPVEVFAPALRVLRDSKYPTQGVKFNRLPKPFITVHAGEDFSHLLSGMRAIDEAVVFCDYGVGDRLGHALAMGVCPKKWACRQDRAYLSVGEHLDNLVWCHQKALSVIQSVPEMVGVLPLLQEKIHYWSEFLYGEAQPPKRLYDAWLLRRNCPIILKSDTQQALKLPEVGQFDPRLSGWVMDFGAQSKVTGHTKHIKLWEKYLFANRDPEFSQRRGTLLSVDCSAQQSAQTFGFSHGRYFDSVSAAELTLYEAIQDWQMEHYAALGIVIEACPTSNIFIGRFEHYKEHPIYRWDPPNKNWLKKGEKFNQFGLRKGPVAVCVNTDDAALMPTTIDNEHRILEQVAVHDYEVGAMVAEDWVERIRQRGLELFRQNHLDWFSEADKTALT
ncbi:antiviral RADAR system adenosine deaminase RdrB [Pseudoalteromonas sp. McH1-42]|uniref:antiviral RADAR system adenosine deaminase RdrB n=1 Tax=Pseudoalteromonas sp. McH1-42 TaxID=2917752 RepID=UPI001EF69934|nr:antiviral RADAR system adenosine deaminase RdrB [Pseudoalteromonas sp. McH1-42]MCG7564137.1 hypothetical protein [Pseudoalteromonas sp. McH1-42]